ncbi:hypothetical protein [Chryseobacterium culicis]|uniref:Cell wall anchor protein n=1 Tax=Chryseobacterium culicis TaxID=680127 RepID=A0A1H6IEW9_CHRCI|nr:hypothetical protein [Chryseobacterium culicis]SEH46953.1 hypothetical protein SAMN05421593_4458 [Chryseobacterium culicis]
MKRKLFIIGVLFAQFTSAQLYTPSGLVNQSSTPTSNNVGIGIADPQSKLTIYEGGGVGSNNFELRTNHLRNPERYFMKNIIFGTGTEDITFSLRHDGQMFVNGNVGVKASTPKATLDIENRFLVSEGAPVSGAAIRSYDTYWARGYGFVDTSVSNNIGQFGAVGPKDNIDYFYVGKDYTNNIVSFYTADKKSIFYGNTAVYGKLEAKEVKVTLTPTADFVFDENYNLPKLEDIEKHIKEKKHLPEIASAKEMEKEGVNVGEFQIKLLQKIEELTLYTIEQNKQLKKQAEEIEELKKNIKNK